MSSRQDSAAQREDCEVSRFLSVLSARWPVDGKRHYLTLGPAGLELGLWVDGGLRTFALEDLEIADPEKTAADIDAILHAQLVLDINGQT